MGFDDGLENASAVSSAPCVTFSFRLVVLHTTVQADSVVRGLISTQTLKEQPHGKQNLDRTVLSKMLRQNNQSVTRLLSYCHKALCGLLLHYDTIHVLEQVWHFTHVESRRI